jgi:8-hydroxy-5-deazaflavin:NADPH oxidoreductase
MKIGIIGKGKVGTSLGKGLRMAGHEVRYGHRDSEDPVKEAAAFGDVIILAVPFISVKDVAVEISDIVSGKVVIDVTNAFGDNEKSVACGSSVAEDLQKILPNSNVVKAFNYAFARNQSSGKVGDEILTAFVAGDDEGARKAVMGLASDIGFDPIDAGHLKSARYLEAMGRLIISLSMDMGMGADIGFRLVR